jgi:NAD(P)H-dependent flavin oxidoreductase YrpB (nitropropane dioxygenase family)
MITAGKIPEIIQGGMGVAVSSWRLAGAVAECGQLGVVSGTALDLVLARRLQDGDEGGHVRRALDRFPDQDVADRVLSRYFLDGGRAEGESYAPILKMAITPNRSSQELLILGGFVETWLAKEGHDGLIGINCLEKIQLSTPGTLYGAMLAGVDVVLMGAGVPRAIPHLLDTLAVHGDVRFDIDVADAGEVQYALDFSPRDVIASDEAPLSRPVFLAIVSAHVLAAYLARDPEIRPDGFVVEASSAGGHNAPPRQQLLDERGDLVFGPRDEPDLQKIAKAGLPYWIAGGSGTPEMLAAAKVAGARGIQVGTVFALSSDSGLDPDVRAQLLEGVARDDLVVRTDPVASPTGFPFKVVDVPGSMSDDANYEARERLCDLGYLRTPFAKDDGTIGYRCAGEPLHMYVRKGGDESDTVGRKCLCNGLAAAVGMGQQRRTGYRELPIVTLGSDLKAPRRLIERYPGGWTAAEAIDWMLSPVRQAASEPADSEPSMR